VAQKELKPIFKKVEEKLNNHHDSIQISPDKATIEIAGQRYVLMRASSLSIEFLEGIKNCYNE
jgi:hypothetical protein